MSKKVNWSDGAGKGWNWTLWQNDDGTYDSEQVTHALLMDVREELKKINQTLRCPSFQGMPGSLRRIASNTAKPKRKKK